MSLVWQSVLQRLPLLIKGSCPSAHTGAEGIRTFAFLRTSDRRHFTIPQSWPCVRRPCQLPLHKGAVAPCRSRIPFNRIIPVIQTENAPREPYRPSGGYHMREALIRGRFRAFRGYFRKGFQEKSRKKSWEKGLRLLLTVVYSCCQVLFL